MHLLQRIPLNFVFSESQAVGWGLETFSTPKNILRSSNLKPEVSVHGTRPSVRLVAK